MKTFFAAPAIMLLVISFVIDSHAADADSTDKENLETQLNVEQQHQQPARYLKINLGNKTSKRSVKKKPLYQRLLEVTSIKSHMARVDFLYAQGNSAHCDEINFLGTSIALNMLSRAEISDHKCFQILQWLARRGVSFKTNDKDLFLFLALEYGKPTSFKYLLEIGADPNSTLQNRSGEFSILWYACSRNDLGAVEQLLIKGADPKIDFGCSYTNPLFTAYRVDNIAMLSMLLDYGVDVNTKDQNGRTLLHYTIRAVRYDYVAILYQNKIDRSSKDNYQQTALEFALASEQDLMK